MKPKTLLTLAAAGMALALLLVAIPAVQAAVAAPPYGLTWGKGSGCGATAFTAQPSCAGCDPYDGDTACSVALPILCIYVSGAPDPNPECSSYYNGWSEGHVAITAAVRGTDLISKANADSICQGQFGAGWRMAEFHDGDPDGNSAGWNFRAYGSLPDYVRFWIYINDQNANCWD